MPSTDISPVYLALNGTASLAHTANTPATTAGYKDRTVDLSELFADAESPTLSYTAVSTDKTIAKVDSNATTGAVAATGMLKVTAVEAGTTTIIVTAFDGVNDGVEATLNVTVVENNTPPSVSVTKLPENLTGKNKLISDSAVEVPFTAVITPGVAGETEEVKFRTVVGTGVATETKYVSAITKAGATSGSYIVTVTRLKAGMDDMSEDDEITIFARDSYGAETMVATLTAEVNAKPRVKRPLPANVYLYRAETDTVSGDLDVLDQSGKYSNTAFNLTDFFAVEMDLVNVVAGNRTGDTTCAFSTNPPQPTAFGKLAAVVATETAPGHPPVPAGRISMATKASVSNGVAAASDPDFRAHYPTALSHGTTADARVVVDSSPTPVPEDTDVTPNIPEDPAAAGTGTFTLTITCRDAESSVSSSTTIEVF